MNESKNSFTIEVYEDSLHDINLEESINDLFKKDVKEIESLSYQKIHFMDGRLITLINKLKRKYHLENVKHFDVLICGYKDEKEGELDKSNPFKCCHFYEENEDMFYLDAKGSSVFAWQNFYVEDYQLEVLKLNGEIIEIHLFVKLVDINFNPSFKC